MRTNWSLPIVSLAALLAGFSGACSSGDGSWALVPPDGGSTSPSTDGASPSQDGAPNADAGSVPPSGDSGVAPPPGPCHPNDAGFPSNGGKLLIDSVDGDITQNEVDTFLGVVSATPIPTMQWAGGGHNYLADGAGGTTLEAINRLYETLGDVPSLSAERTQLLDLAIRWSDAWLTHRNDLPMGEHRVMWTGQVEPVWPPEPPPDPYAGCEVGQTIGILAYTALNIVKTPAIWNETVSDCDPNGYGATYLERANTYETMLEQSMSQFFNKQFLDMSTMTIQHPSSAAYNATPSNNVNAWNREMMFLHAWQTLSELHAALGDQPQLVTMYQTITNNAVDLFVQNVQPRTAADGTPIYDWGYGNFGDEKGNLTGEQVEIHAEYDIWGLVRAHQAGLTSVTPQQLKTFADTIVHETMISPGVYADYIDRCCSTGTHNYLGGGLMMLAPYTTGLYKPAATGEIMDGRQAGSADLTVSILWAKHYFAVNKQMP